MKVYVGADHNGFYLRDGLIKYLKESGHEVDDDGNDKLDPNDDYPVFAARVVHSLSADDDEQAKGILICGSGQGMCIAANRFRGIRACLGYDKESVQLSRNDDDCNILCLPANVLKQDQANSLVETFLNTPFAKAPRFVRRLKEIDELV